MIEGISGVQIAWQEKLDKGEFVIQRCATCERHVFYPRSLCPHCGDDALEWVASGGHGTVYSTTTVRRSAEAGGDYNVSLIDLEEGVRLMSRVETAPDRVAIGQAVRARIVERNGHGLLVFDGLVEKDAK